MKKNFINTIAFLLCGAMFFSSCEDMLAPDSTRVEYDFSDWTFNDSVYSVLGILNAVQKVGDRQILLGELRGDLVTINNNTLDDVKDLSNFEFNAESNEYLDVKDYYSIINNCNLFLARVDTTLSYDKKNLMLREYVAVKSVRAWTYMQLMKNHAYIPFFTEPVLTNGKAEEIMSDTPADQLTVIDYLIKDIAPFEDPSDRYRMPLWEVPGYATAGMTAKLFMPIRVLLGDLYLWRASLRAENASYPLPYGNPNSDYAMAAQYYYKYLTIDNEVADNVDISQHTADKPDSNPTYYPGRGFSSRFDQDEFTKKTKNFVAAIRYSANENTGSISNLAALFAPVNEVGKNQIEASPAIRAISNRQTYIQRSGSYPKYTYETIKSTRFPGDLRIYSVVASQRGDDLNKTLHSNMIVKFNLKSNAFRQEGDIMMYTPNSHTLDIMLDRPEYVYLRFAEALVGLAREGYSGAAELAMTVLKSGLKDKYSIYWKPETVIDTLKDATTGKYVMEPLIGTGNKQVMLNVVQETTNEAGEVVLETIQVPQYAPLAKEIQTSEYGVIEYDFSGNAFINNTGIHSRGCGAGVESDGNYAFADSCVAAHFGIPAEAEKVTVKIPVYNENGYLSQAPVQEVDADGEPVYELAEDGKTKLPVYKLDEDGNVAWEFVYEEKEVNVYNVTDEQRIEYLYDKLIDEMALEMAFEGHRFGDLVRMATALGNPDFFARRVAARNVAEGDWRTAEGAEGWDAALYGRLLDKNNWFLPLSSNYLKPLVEPFPPADPVIPEPDNSGDDNTTEEGTEGGNNTTEGEENTENGTENI